MSAQTVSVSHLGGSQIGYAFAAPYDPELPTLVMINSFTTSVELYRPQFANAELTSRMNLLAVEPYGHGATRATYAQFTYWDSAIAALQVLEALGIDRAYALGTSQGGWIVARMAILAPDVIDGILMFGTSMDYESQASRDRGCWDGADFCTPTIDGLADPVDEEWTVDADFVHGVLAAGLGDDVSDEEKAFWVEQYQQNYRGDAGRRRLRTAAINLRDRDGIEARLDAVTCPVLWLQGTADIVYSVPNAQDGIARFTASPNAGLQVVDGGQHFMTASHPEVADAAILQFVK